jgi:hypothetical protein
MRKWRYRKATLLLLSAACGISTGALTVGGFAILILDSDVARLSPWLDPRDVTNWLVLCGSAVAAIVFALLAEAAEPPAVPAAAPAHPPVHAASSSELAPAEDLARAA